MITSLQKLIFLLRLICMAKHTAYHLFLFPILTLVLVHFQGVINSTTICTQTPYPELCNSLIIGTTSQNLNYFRHISLKATLAEAENMHKLISNMDPSSLKELGKTAWADCVDLNEDTIYQLNRSVVGSKNDPVDVQTWLSAAIANEQACQNGFLDFNLHSSPFMLIMSNLSKLLSNSLAVNKIMASSSSSPAALYNTNQNMRTRGFLDHDQFPAWVSPGDRKLLQSWGASDKADIVVAQDGSGNYKTISEALAAAAKRRSGTKRFVIHVKKGIYKENVEVKRWMKNIMLIGDGIDETIVTGNKNVHDGSTTFSSATFATSGDGFIGRGITFENTAGAEKQQAVAVRCSSDFSVFHECSFMGYQDTLYVYSQRQFYRDCNIYGTVDFIFGDAVSVIQNCNIYIRQGMPNQKKTVTAQGRKDPNENTGIIIHNSHVAAAAAATIADHTGYLGRPWQRYSRTVFIKCRIDGVIHPAGWIPWNGNFALTTLFYGEYMNTGSGATTSGRVNWPGFHLITTPTQAAKFSVRNFLAGDSWIPATGVPFTSGL